ncbi:hypothetical protein HYV30_03670 [Candidatus Kaiserbacteria bacterium]|nr:hypothetical protein [Candidatus Kaiserbacteria bacterium]
MARTILERAPIRIPDTPELLGQEMFALAKEAHSVLGYAGLMTADGVVQTLRRQCLATAAEALESLGIEPFTIESVEAYKKEERERVIAEEIAKIDPGVLRRRARAGHIALSGCVAAALGSFSLLLFGNTISVGFLVGGIVTAACSGWFWTVFGFNYAVAVARAESWSWVSRPIDMYNNPQVPTAAVRTAIALKKLLPECVVEIESLEHMMNRAGDPFLRIGFPMPVEDKLYIHIVWGEPNYSAKFE